MTRSLCFTVDLDRDVNICLDGQVSAGSIDRGCGTSPRFISTVDGLVRLLDLLDDMDVRATFFAEGRTIEHIGSEVSLSGHEVGIHGLDHEDLTGGNNVNLAHSDAMDIINAACSIVRDVTSKSPRCFRAPYMRLNDDVLEALPGLGIHYDSSCYCDLSRKIVPEHLLSGLVRVPVPEGYDSHGKKIAAYLWPMHENKRPPSDYVEMASAVEEGIFNIATHTWHMTESRKDGPMSSERIRSNLDNVRSVLGGIIDMGFVPGTIPEACVKYSRG